MIKGGNVIICYASTDRGVHSIHLVYNVRGSSIYLYSVRGADKSDESGKFVHWETIKHLKGAGQDWYDLCGVPSLDKDSGLYRFKAGFGGDLIDLGREFLFQSAAIRAARQLVRS
jgi:lipid II:glycine glycyltransferase (peptidoglycan interpeptide bridge formation enzyme)